MDDDVVIRVKGLWKRYGGIRADLKRLLSFRRNGRAAPVEEDGPWALRDINFEVRRGETFGIIGRNGAGKSTLLKVLSGVTPPTYGNVEMRGRVFPMIQLNAGLHHYLTGRQNTNLLGAVMGFSRKEMQDRMPQIEEFCELGEWFDQPVWKYSSGMLARLGFAVAINVDANILLVDEILAVGDTAFRRKCYRRMEELRSGSVTTVFVSHAIRQVERLCDRVIVLDNGKIAFAGEADEAANYYYDKVVVEEQKRHIEQMQPVSFAGNGEIVVTRVEVLDSAGQPTDTLRMFEDVLIRVEYYANTKVERAIVGIGILTVDMIQVALQTNANVPERVNREGPGVVTCKFVGLNLMPGAYTIKIGMKGADGRPIYKATGLANFEVKSDRFDEIRECGGLVYTHAIWG